MTNVCKLISIFLLINNLSLFTEAKNNNTLVKFTYYSNNNCYLKTKFENYKIQCSNLKSLDICCNKFADSLYKNISFFHKEWDKNNEKSICFKYKDNYLNYNCEKNPFSNDIYIILFYVLISILLSLFFIINICCCCPYYCDYCYKTYDKGLYSVI